MKFSQYYNKLDLLKKGETITVFRRNINEMELGDTIEIRYRDEKIYSEITDIQRIAFNQIPEETFIKETAPYANDIQEAKAHVRSRYRKNIRATEGIYILYLKKSEVFEKY